jgi:uncharacterized protein YjbI with pentapeptide repeats
MKLFINTWASNLRRLFAIIVCLLMFTLGNNLALAEDYDKQLLEGADFSGKVLQGSQFNKAVLRGTKFVGADLKGVSLFGADMMGADFSNANLSFSTLDTARMDEVNLTNAILEGAFTYGTTFKRAQITGADFTDVDLREPLRQKLCEVASGTNSVTKRKTRDTLECDA